MICDTWMFVKRLGVLGSGMCFFSNGFLLYPDQQWSEFYLQVQSRLLFKRCILFELLITIGSDQLVVIVIMRGDVNCTTQLHRFIAIGERDALHTQQGLSAGHAQ